MSKHIWRGWTHPASDTVQAVRINPKERGDCIVITDSAGIPVREAIALARAYHAWRRTPTRQNPESRHNAMQKYIRAVERMKKGRK